MLSEEIIAKLNVGVNTHASSPHKDLIIISQSKAMVVAEADIFDSSWAARCVRVMIYEFNLVRSLHIECSLLLDTKLSVVIVSPSEHLAFSGQHSSEEISTCYFYDWDVKVDHVWDGRDIFKFVLRLLCRDLI